MKLKAKISKIKKVLTPIGNLVLATSDKSGNIHICVMSYVLSDDNTLLLSCEKISTKVRNIRENPRVGMSLFERQEKPSLLMYGAAKLLEDEEADLAYREILSKVPHYKAFTSKNRCFIRVKLEKIIYEYYGKGKEEYFEVENDLNLSGDFR